MAAVLVALMLVIKDKKDKSASEESITKIL
jgi:hypothetical protein